MRHCPHRSPASRPSWQEENKPTAISQQLTPNTHHLTPNVLKYPAMISDFEVKRRAVAIDVSLVEGVGC
jgi:hypothetical protein